MADVDEIPDVVKPGEIIDGKYLVEARLGAGGMGIVVAARHVAGGGSVAVKLLYPAALANREAIARFSREAKAAARLTSEHAVKVLDVGKTANGAPYLVMERLEGADLAGVLGAGGPLGVELAADYLLQACEALAEAHALGIVHRDLKSSNLFLTKGADGSPCVKVLDFGISKMLELGGEGGTVLTATQTMLGSPAYMSPEQLVSARQADARSDIWGLGVIFYELITGALPFDGASMMQLFTNIARSAPAPLPEAVPREVSAVIFKCLEKAPANRFADAVAFANAIAPFASSAGARTSLPRIARLSAAAAARALPIDEDAPTLLIDEPSNAAAARTLDGDPQPAARGASRLALVAAGMALSLIAFGGAGLMFLRLESLAPTPSAPPVGAAAAPREPTASAVVSHPAPAAAPSATAAASAESSAASASTQAPTAAPRASARAPSAPVAPKRAPRSADPFDTRN